MMDSVDLFNVIHKCQNGDEKACEQLYLFFKDFIYRTALVILGSREDAEDVVQSTFIKLFGHLDTYDSARSIKAWIHRMTVNSCMDLIRSKKRQINLVERAMEFFNPSLVFDSRGLFDNELTIMLQRLSVKLRVVLVLRYLCDMSQEEIASALGIPVGTVKSRLGDGLRRLRMMCDSEEFAVGLGGSFKDARTHI